jgi:hypothetical protein
MNDEDRSDLSGVVQSVVPPDLKASSSIIGPNVKAFLN